MAVVFAIVAMSQTATGQARGPRIRAIILQRDAVFDSSEARHWAYRLANTLHVETRRGVIRRELLVDVGDPYDSELVAESERNLRALGIFREVRIERQDSDSGVVLVVRTADAWTTTLAVGAATSGSQSVIDLSMQEANLLGTRTAARVGYRNDPDRSTIAMSVDMPRAIDNRFGAGLSLLQRSDGRGATGSLRLPFLSLSSRTGASLVASVVEGRVLQFRGSTVADSLWRESALLRADAAYAIVAGPRGYVRVGILAQWLRDDMVALEDRPAIPHTPLVTAGPYVTVRRPRFIRMHNVERIGRTEDFDLGAFATASVLAAPAAWGYARPGAGASLGTGIGLRLPGGFARFRVRGSILQTSEGTDSASVDGVVTAVLQRGERHLTVMHASGGRQQNVVPGREYDMGLGVGLRAYPAHAFTGDRFFLLVGEYRYLLFPRFLGLLGIGVGAFAAHAGAWDDGTPRRTGTEFGAGLRLSSIREAGGIWRVDLARRPAGAGFAAGWVASLGRGFVFGGI